MTEFTATLPLKIEVTIKAKSRKEASSMFDDLYLNISIENDGNQVIEVLMGLKRSTKIKSSIIVTE